MTRSGRHSRRFDARVSLVAALLAVTACGEMDHIGTGQPSPDAAEVASSSATFESSVKRDFEVAAASGAAVQPPSSVTASGFGVVVGTPAAIPFASPAKPLDDVANSGFVQEPAFFVVPYDGSAPLRLPLPDSAAHRVREVTAAATNGDVLLVATLACDHSYHHEPGDFRPYGCHNELWRSTGLRALEAVAHHPEASSELAYRSVAVTADTVIVDGSTGIYTSGLDALDWARVADPTTGGRSRSCALSDGTLIRLATDRDDLEVLRPGTTAPVRDSTVEPAPSQLNELVCGALIAYRLPFRGPTEFAFARVDSAGSVSSVENPGASGFGPPYWVLDQLTGDLVGPAADGSTTMMVVSEARAPIPTQGEGNEFRDSTGRLRALVPVGGCSTTWGHDGSMTIDAIDR